MKNQDTKKPKPDDLPAFVDAYFSHLQFAPHVPAQFKDYLKGHLHAFALSMRAQYRPAIMVSESVIEDVEAFEKQFAVCNPTAVRVVPLESINTELLQALKDMIPLAASYAGTHDETTKAREKFLKARMIAQRAELSPYSTESISQALQQTIPNPQTENELDIPAFLRRGGAL